MSGLRGLRGKANRSSSPFRGLGLAGSGSLRSRDVYQGRLRDLNIVKTCHCGSISCGAVDAQPSNGHRDLHVYIHACNCEGRGLTCRGHVGWRRGEAETLESIADTPVGWGWRLRGRCGQVGGGDGSRVTRRRVRGVDGRPRRVRGGWTHGPSAQYWKKGRGGGMALRYTVKGRGEAGPTTNTWPADWRPG